MVWVTFYREKVFLLLDNGPVSEQQNKHKYTSNIEKASITKPSGPTKDL